MVERKAEKNKEAAGVVSFSFVFNITGKRLKTFSGWNRHTSRGMSVLGITLQQDNNMTKINWNTEQNQPKQQTTSLILFLNLLSDFYMQDFSQTLKA